MADDLSALSDEELNARIRTIPGMEPAWNLQGVDPGSDEAHSRISDFLHTHAVAGKTWEQTLGNFTSQFPLVNPTGLDREYKQHQQGLALDRERQKLEGTEETTASWLKRRSIPIVSTVLNVNRNRAFAAAQQRYKAGEATPDDLSVIANYEKVQDVDKAEGESYGGAIKSGLAHVPAIAGEFATGGVLLKGLGLGAQAASQAGKVAVPLFSRAGLATALGRTAAQTAVVPSMYAEQWTKNNLDAGRDALDPKGFPAAFALGMLQTAVFKGTGAAGEQFGSKGLAGWGQRWAAGTAGGVAGQQVADVLGGTLGLQTGYGAVGDLLQGKGGDALRHLTTQLVTFGAFTSLHAHNRPEWARQNDAEMARYAATLKAMHGRGEPADRAAVEYQQPMELIGQALEANPDLSPAQVRQMMEALPEGPGRSWGLWLADNWQERSGPGDPPGGLPSPPAEGEAGGWRQLPPQGGPGGLPGEQAPDLPAAGGLKPPEAAPALKRSFDVPLTRKNIEAEQKRRADKGLEPATPEEIVHNFVTSPEPRHLERAKEVMNAMATEPLPVRQKLQADLEAKGVNVDQIADRVERSGASSRAEWFDWARRNRAWINDPDGELKNNFASMLAMEAGKTGQVPRFKSKGMRKPPPRPPEGLPPESPPEPPAPSPEPQGKPGQPTSDLDATTQALGVGPAAKEVAPKPEAPLGNSTESAKPAAKPFAERFPVGSQVEFIVPGTMSRKGSGEVVGHKKDPVTGDTFARIKTASGEEFAGDANDLRPTESAKPSPELAALQAFAAKNGMNLEKLLRGVGEQVQKLGTVAAVDKAYFQPSSPIHAYARNLARNLFGEKAAEPARAEAAPAAAEAPPAEPPKTAAVEEPPDQPEVVRQKLARQIGRLGANPEQVEKAVANSKATSAEEWDRYANDRNLFLGEDRLSRKKTEYARELADEAGRQQAEAAKPEKGVKPEAVEEAKKTAAQQALKFLKGEEGSLDLDKLKAGWEAVKKFFVGKPTEGSEGSVVDDIKKAFAPAARGKEAEVGAGNLRYNLAKERQAKAIAQEELQKGQSFFREWTENAPDQPTRLTRFRQFTDAMEQGKIDTLPPELRPFAEAARKLIEQREQQAKDRGMIPEESIDNYMAHLWKKPGSNLTPEQISNILGARRPLQGKQGFTRRRTITSYSDGLDAGLEPVSWNPVDLVLLGLEQVDKAIMAHDARAEWASNGLYRFIEVGGEVPEGWTRHQGDTIFTRGRRGPETLGHFYSPEPLTRLVNNYLEPGLGDWKAFRIAREFGGVLTNFQLGFTAFHAGFVTVDTIVSRLGLGVRQLTQGRIGEGLKNILSSPLAPIQDWSLGSKLLAEYKKPGSQGAEMGAILDALLQGGGSINDTFIEGGHIKAFTDAIRSVRRGEGGVGSVLYNALPALSEFFSKPVMEQLVPRMKLGVFADMARAEMEKLPANADSNAKQAAYGRAWDSVENRLGQMTYDNLFWNRTFKDLAMVSVRAVGWNLGTWRELGGGLKDLGQAYQGIKSGEGISHRLAYVAALPIMVGAMGAFYQYLATGKGPDETKDYFFPRTGKRRPDGSEDRVALPSYMRDVASLLNRADEGPMRIAQNAYTMAKHKANPLISVVADMLGNEDFHGTAIRNPNDPMVKQSTDTAFHLLKAMKPMGADTILRQKERGDLSASTAAQGFVGVTPATSNIVHSWQEQRDKESGRRFEPTGLEKKRREDAGSLSGEELQAEKIRAKLEARRQRSGRRN